VRTLTYTDLTVNRFEQSENKLDTSTLRTERREYGNSGFKKLAVQWLQEVQFPNETFVVTGSLVFRNRQLLVVAKRYVQFNRNDQTVTDIQIKSMDNSIFSDFSG